MHALSVTNALWALLAALAAMPARSAEPDPSAPPALRPEIIFSEHLYDGAMASPVALTWSPRVDEFHVLDSASRLVGIFDARGYPVFAFVGAAALSEPRDLAVDAAGRAYVLEGAARIRTFSYRGEPLGELELPELHAAGKSARIAAIALDVDGNLVVVDEALQEVLVYDLATRRIRARFGGRGEGSGRFESIRAVASDAAHYYVLDALGVAIQVFDRKGRFVRGWGEHDIGPEAFSLPAAIAAHPRGWIVAADAIRSELKIFDPEGRLLARAGGYGADPGLLAYPSDLAIDAEGRIAVAEKGNGRVQVFRVVEPTTRSEVQSRSDSQSAVEATGVVQRSTP